MRISRISDLSCYALSFCAAAATLGGCGGSGQLPNPATQTSLGNAGTHRRTSPNYTLPPGIGPNSSGAEKLTGTARLGQCQERYIGHGNLILGVEYRTDFRARGKATGPHPGTFTATGHWGFGFEYPFAFWSLVERFIITSRTSTISGTIRGGGFGGESVSLPTCTLFGPEIASDADGDAYIKRIKQGGFRETLGGL
jgi:hypothetical protein